MTEQQDLIARLEKAGVLDGVRWAYASTCTRALDDYSEPNGYEATWFGITRHVLFCDRLDRVFSTGRYRLGPDADPTDGIDLLHDELTEQDVASLPKLPAGLVRRADLNGSPGWAAENIRFLIQSSPVGKAEEIRWPQKRPTKQRVARQRNPEPPVTLFTDVPEAQEWLEALRQAEKNVALDLETFVVAHSLGGLSGRRSLAFGRPRFNSGGGSAWHWIENLLTTPLPPASGTGDPVRPTGPDSVPDAPVTLRPNAAKNTKASEQ